MKIHSYYFLCLVVCCLLNTTLVVAQDSITAKKTKTTKIAKPIDPSKPQFKFEEEVYDFGNVEAGAEVSHTFRFKNTGKTPLTILSAKGSCGCTKVEANYSPILANKTDQVTAHYHASADGKGKFVKLITIYSNAEPRLKTLTIKGNIIPKKK